MVTFVDSNFLSVSFLYYFKYVVIFYQDKSNVYYGVVYYVRSKANCNIVNSDNLLILYY